MKQRNYILGMLAFVPLLALGGGDSLSEVFQNRGADVVDETYSATVDGRVVIPVTSESVLDNLAYSSVGWDIVPDEVAARTVAIMAQSGYFTKGAFVADGDAEFEVLAEMTGRGTCRWQVTTELITKIQKGKTLYRLVHAVKDEGVDDPSETLYGYFDFDLSVLVDRTALSAALAEVSHPVLMVDHDRPWRPVDAATVRSGIVTDPSLEAGATTAMKLFFTGMGSLAFEYALDGGRLAVVAGGVERVLPATGGAWAAADALEFSDADVHEVMLVYTAAGDGSTAKVRHVRWLQADRVDYLSDVRQHVRLDTREGVRAPRSMTHVLPFEWSSTNWIGDVVGVSATSVARVTIVRLTGTDPDVRNWTEEVPNTFTELVNGPGEGSVRWKPVRGVWKATFDILNDDKSIHREEVLFDLRKSGLGLALILK